MYQDGAYSTQGNAQGNEGLYPQTNDSANVANGEGYAVSGDGYTTTGDGYAANSGDVYEEGGTDVNYGYTDQGGSTENKDGFDATAAAAAAAAAGGGDYHNEYYDPNSYQGYYQDTEGNYYYYPTDPQEEMANETVENAGVAPTPNNLIRSYEYEDWEPKRYCWFVDIVVDTFLSKPFLVYLTILFYCAAVLIATLGLDYTFALSYRMFAPPDPKGNQDIQSFAYVSTFFYLSFIIVSAFCALFDMLRNLWWQEREDVLFWGFSHNFLVKRNPPFVIYLIVILVTVPLPILWGLVDAAVNHQSYIFFAQRCVNVAVLVATFLVVICYVWFLCLSFARKRQAVHYRKQWDDFYLRTKAYRHTPEKMVKTHWYHSSKVMEEFGMDRQTLRYNVLVFVVGCVPLFALYAATTLNTHTGDPSVAWGAISSIAVICLFFVAWLTLFDRKAQWSMYISFVFMAIFLILGIVGGALGSYPQTIGVVVVTFVASGGMMTRKRRHALSRKELCAILKVPLNKDIEQRKENKRVDSYLFCCRNVILDYMKCCDIKTWFGYRHPDVVRAERRYAIKNIALRTDQKMLLVWWLIVMFAVAFVIAGGNAVSYKYTTPVAGMANRSVNGTSPAHMLCTMRFNEAGAAPMTLLDLSYLAALSYTFGTNGDADFVTWFSSKPQLVRAHPAKLPPTLNFATDGVNVTFSDYVDTSSNFHFITLNSNNRGLSVFRNMDDWGESIAFQIAGAIAPFFNIWPEQYRRDIIQLGAFLKKWFPPSRSLHNVTTYVDTLLSEGVSPANIVLVGDQFNGGYAKLLASNFSSRNISFVAFNPPGVKYKVPFLRNGIQLSSTRSLWSYIDSLEDAENTFYMDCSDRMSSTHCGRINTTIDYLTTLCGDTHGRSISNI